MSPLVNMLVEVQLCFNGGWILSLYTETQLDFIYGAHTAPSENILLCLAIYTNGPWRGWVLKGPGNESFNP